MTRQLKAAGMLRIQDAIVIIPALNEEGSVGEVVTSAINMDVREVVVIDDCSKDQTANNARKAGATVISLAEGLGAWGATQTGFRYAVRRGARIVVTMDADGQHRSADLENIIGPITRGGANVVIACCTTRGSRLRAFAWSCIKRVSHISVSDITSGFRAYDRLAVRRLAAWPANLIEYQDVGILLLLQKHHLTIAEMEVMMATRRNGKSRIFASWSAVAYYMAQTLLLGASKRSRLNLTSISEIRQQ